MKALPPLSRRAVLGAAGGSLAMLGTGCGPAAEPDAADTAKGPLDRRDHKSPAGDLIRQANALDPREFGAVFDGVSDASPGLQRAVDAAHEQARPLHLPRGTALLQTPLSLIGREVHILGGGATRTAIKAGRAMPALIDAQDPTSLQLSPFTLAEVMLDGAGLADRALAITHRHHTVLDRVNVLRAKTGVWEKDTWLSRRFDCRVSECEVGWDLVGANHSSLWQGCTFTGCSRTHLHIGTQGSAMDGNSALLFRSCDVEHGGGVGVAVDGGVNAVFDACYLGENIDAEVIRNYGIIEVRGGMLAFGRVPTAVGVRPLSGRAILNGVTINGQGGSIPTLIGLDPATAPDTPGRVRMTDMNAYLPVGGTHIIGGDCLDRIPMTVFAPRLGRDWQAWSRDADVVDAAPEGQPDARTIRCRAARGAGAAMSLAGALTQQRWRERLPLYLALVYSASKPIRVRLADAAGGGPELVFADLPPAKRAVTFINVHTLAPAKPFAVLEALMAGPAAGDWLTIHEAALADGSVVRNGVGELATLALAQ
jgi:hypothetical protein